MPPNKPIIWGAAPVVVGGAIALYLYSNRPHDTTPPASAPQVQGTLPVAPPVAASAPVVEYPVPVGSAPESQPAPALDQSDQPFHDALTAVPGAQASEKLLG